MRTTRRALVSRSRNVYWMRTPSRVNATPSEFAARRRSELNVATFFSDAMAWQECHSRDRDFNHDSGATSLNLEIELLDQDRPLRLFAVNVGGVFLRARWQRISAIGRDPFAHGRRIKQGFELPIETRNDLRRGMSGREHA